MSDHELKIVHADTTPNVRVGIQEKPRLVIAGRDRDLEKAIDSGSKLDPAPETWPGYLAWRRTKCRPFTRDDGHDRVLEEIDQATHELAGELAEIGELLQQHGPYTVIDGEGGHRAKLIDECGDAIFCACWSLDAWGVNLLAMAPDGVGVEIVESPPAESNVGHMASLIRDTPDIIRDAIRRNDWDTINGIQMFLMNSLFNAMVGVGLTSNAFKKLRYQRRDQDRELQCDRVMTAMESVNAILIMIGSSMAEAMASNRKKLDARFPEGYKPGVGGGIRTGDGR